MSDLSDLILYYMPHISHKGDMNLFFFPSFGLSQILCGYEYHQIYENVKYFFNCDYEYVATVSA